MSAHDALLFGVLTFQRDEKVTPERSIHEVHAALSASAVSD
jgi:hypothetical protein